MKMKTIDKLIELQDSYEEMRRYNKILKDGTHIYLLKKLKDDFQECKLKYKDICDRLDEIKKELEAISCKINDCRHKLLEKEEMINKVNSREHKLMEELRVYMEGIKTSIKKYEDDSLILMENEENLEIEKEKLRVELLNIKNNFYIKKEEVNEEIVVAQKEVLRLKNDIVKIENSIPCDIRKLFKDLIDKNLNAVVSLEGGMCSGCRMKVSALTVDNIYRGEEVVCCNNCGRILFYDLKNLKSAR
jgi:predicted  nucleic acid-binding Zn-ribbon protein